MAQIVVVPRSSRAFDVVHPLGEIVDAERDRGNQKRANVAHRLHEIPGRVGQVQAELADRRADRRRLHQHVETKKPRQPGEERADHNGGEPARQPIGQPHPGRPADQHDRKRHQEQPRLLPAEKGRTHRDEGDRDPGQRPEHRRARREAPDRRPDKGAQQHNEPDDETPHQPRLPRQHRVLGLQIDRQHDQKDDDEHVRHGGAIRHRRHVAAVLALAQPPGQIRVIEIAERQRDAEGRQDAAIDDVAGHLDDTEAQPGQHDNVEQDVGEQTEKPVPVARHPPARASLHSIGAGDAHAILLWQFPAPSAAMTACDRPTQPKIPPCALIIRSPISWNSGK